MARSKHHKSNMSDSEWRRTQNRKRESQKRLEKRRQTQAVVERLHKRRYNNPLTSPVVTKQSFTQKMLSRLGLNKARRDNT